MSSEACDFFEEAVRDPSENPVSTQYDHYYLFYDTHTRIYFPHRDNRGRFYSFDDSLYIQMLLPSRL